MYFRLILSLGLFFPSMAFSANYYEELVQKIDPNKKTVCNITINSEEEKETFQERLSSEEFNFVELIDPNGRQANRKKPSWFQQACSSGIECDVLLISGHFGGSFFGKSGFRLSTEDLEYQSCDNRCDGILKKPKEVFLFGCNTLAGKEKDHRAPEEYRQVLLDDYFDPVEADQIVAFRYSGIGHAFYDRMRSVFSNSRIYGFDSVSPSGRNVKSKIDDYLEEIGSYSHYLNNFQKNLFNQNWKQSLSYTARTQTEGLKNEANEKICLVTDPKKSNSEKIKIIKNLFFDFDNILSNLPIINIYFRSKRSNGYVSRDEIASLNEIKNNTEASSLFKKYINRDKFNFLSIKNQMINVGWHVNWWSTEEAINLTREGIIKNFNMLEDDSDLLCSLDFPYSRKNFIKFEDLPQGDWNEDILKIIRCFNINDGRVVEKIFSEIYKDPDKFSLMNNVLCGIDLNRGLKNEDLPEENLSRGWLQLIDCLKPDQEVKNRILSEFSSYKNKQINSALYVLCKIGLGRKLTNADLPKDLLSEGWLGLIFCLQPNQDMKERILSEFSSYEDRSQIFARKILCKFNLGRKLTNADLPKDLLSEGWLELIICLRANRDMKERILSEFSSYEDRSQIFSRRILCKFDPGRKLTNADLPIGRLSKDSLLLIRCLESDQEIRERIVSELSSYEDDESFGASYALCGFYSDRKLTNADLPEEILSDRWLAMIDCSKPGPEIVDRVFSELSSYEEWRQIYYAKEILCNFDPGRKLTNADLPTGRLSKESLELIEKLITCLESDQEVRDRVTLQLRN